MNLKAAWCHFPALMSRHDFVMCDVCSAAAVEAGREMSGHQNPVIAALTRGFRGDGAQKDL